MHGMLHAELQASSQEHINMAMLSYVAEPHLAWGQSAPFMTPGPSCESIVGDSRDPNGGVLLHGSQVAILQALHRPLEIVQGPPGTVHNK